jgi:hypothetical protein
MKYEILVWLVAGLFGFRRPADVPTWKDEQLSLIDFIGSLGAGGLAMLPVLALAGIVNRLTGIVWLQPGIGWLYAALLVAALLVMVLAIATWGAFLVHIRQHRWSEFSAHNQQQLALLARIVPPFYVVIGIVFSLALAIAFMNMEHLPWWAGAIIFVVLLAVGDIQRGMCSWGVYVLDDEASS